MMRYRRKSHELLILVMEAVINGSSLDELSARLERGMRCELCRAGIPVENGKHQLPGIELTCLAEHQQACPEKPKKPPVVFRGRGIRKRGGER